MLDETTINMISSFKKTNWLFEETESDQNTVQSMSNLKDLKAGDAPYDELVKTLKEYLKGSIILEISSFRFSKNPNKTSVEVEGKIQNALDFRFNFGLNDGVYISTGGSDMLLNPQIVEGIGKLHTYFLTQFPEIYTLLIEK